MDLIYVCFFVYLFCFILLYCICLWYFIFVLGGSGVYEFVSELVFSVGCGEDRKGG